METLSGMPDYITVEASDEETKVVPIQTDTENRHIFGDPEYGSFAVIKDCDGKIKIIGRFDRYITINFGEENKESTITVHGPIDLDLSQEVFPFTVTIEPLNKVFKVSLTDTPPTTSPFGAIPIKPPPFFSAVVELKETG